MKYGDLTNEEALAVMSARMELHFLRRAGCGGASELACVARLMLGVILTAGAILRVGRDSCKKPQKRP